MWVKRPEENSIVTQPADFGGCTSAPTRFAVLPWEGALPIEAGGVQACVGRYAKKDYDFRVVACGPISWRVNHKR